LTCQTEGFVFSPRHLPPVTAVAPIFRKLIAIALVLAMQGPAMLVQEVAWVKMLISYTQERGLAEGVIRTFDGNHPCGLCAKAAEIRKQQHSGDPAEQQPSSLRFRLVWTEMVSFERIRLPKFSGPETAVLTADWIVTWQGRGADSPESPAAAPSSPISRPCFNQAMPGWHLLDMTAGLSPEPSVPCVPPGPVVSVFPNDSKPFFKSNT